MNCEDSLDLKNNDIVAVCCQTSHISESSNIKMESNELIIRKSVAGDLERMLAIYEKAKAFMANTGNPTQWGDSYPSVELLRRDIAEGISHVVVSDNKIVGTFVFIIGDEPTYSEIEGEWINDEPYGTIHRIASDGSVRGIADFCLKYCFGIIGNIRIDTHNDNNVMLKWIKRSGFIYCGIIHVADGSPRLAFQKTDRAHD